MKERAEEIAAGEQPFVDASRDALVTALMSAGPNRPTLVDGWQTQHLAAHIYLRESSPLAAGQVFKPLAEKLQERTMELGDEVAKSNAAYQNLLNAIATGPAPGFQTTQTKLVGRLRRSWVARRLDEISNLLVFFVHTEDVRRAQGRWAPRKLQDSYADALFEQLRRQAKLHYKDAKNGVALVRSNGERIVAKNGSQFTYISGPAGELVMHAFGRTDHALVLIDQA